MPTKPGRNEPCWCGSGKKYKHCHMQEDQQAAAAPPPTETATAVESTARESTRLAPYVPPSASEPSPADLASEAEWARFRQVDSAGKVAIFLEKLDQRNLEDEDSFEMLLAIREESDVKHNAEARARFAALIDRLRREMPEVYQSDQHFYLRDLIEDALADQNWAALPDLLNDLARLLPKSIDEFFRVVYAALYHGQAAAVRAALQVGWSQVVDTEDILSSGVNEYGGLLMRLMLYAAAEKATAPRDADSDLWAALRAYGTPDEVWLGYALRHLTRPAPTRWQAADFNETVEADQWAANIDGLLFEFMADQQRQAQVPFSKSDLARIELTHVLNQQGVQAPDPVKRAKGKTRHRSAHLPTAQTSPLIPRYETLNRELARHFSFLSSQPYHAGAPLELLPAYLHFIARRGLIHPTELDQALTALRALIAQTDQLFTNYGADVYLAQAIEAAWSETNLDALRRDPALEAARAQPIVIAAPIEVAVPRTFTLKVTYRPESDVWFMLELRGDQTLHDLHFAILDAADFDSDHMYSFYLSGRAWDEATEYGLQQAKHSSRTRLDNLRLRLKQRWLYLFDYGDQHEFDVQLIATSSDQPSGDYPRLIEQHGQMPPQYPDWEDEDEYEGATEDVEDEGEDEIEEWTDDDLDPDEAA